MSQTVAESPPPSADPARRSAAAPDEARKTVTVVFSDVTGSTGLGEQLDPESLRRVMSRYFDEMRIVLERHGGTVEKFIGDAVMAVFGIPTLHEDDALRAVTAASEMRSALEHLNDELEGEWGVRIQVRTGVNTGEVIAGDAAAGQSFASGDTVNVAARLEQAAGPGQILIGDQTYALVRHAVTAEPVEPLSLKGKALPVMARSLGTVAGRAPSMARRLDSRMVGRERELQLVHSFFERARASRAPHLVVILGPAGIGKSRLTQEIITDLKADALVLRGRCLPYGEGITFWPIAEVVKEAAGITEQESAAAARAKIEALLPEGGDSPLVSERVATLIGLAAAGAGIQEGYWAVRRLLQALAVARPLVVVLDDMHWAEPAFLDLIDYVFNFTTDAALMLLCISRPEVLEARPDWGPSDDRTLRVRLEPLPESQSYELIANLLDRAPLAPTAIERISSAAQGNPLFVEEMLRMLVDDGLLQRRGDEWVAAGNLENVSIPPTINALLTARLDRLDGEERAVIQRGSVVGQVFYWGAVAELSPHDARDGVGAYLQALVRKELIRPDLTDLSGEDAFRFSHILVKDAAYNALPKALRAELHERFAGWLEEMAGDRRPEYEEIIGYHLEQAYRYRSRLGPVSERDRLTGVKAVESLSAAGLRAHDRDDLAAAVNLLSRAAAVLPRDDPARLEILPHVAVSMLFRGDFEPARAVVTELTDSAPGNRRLEAYALLLNSELATATDSGKSSLLSATSSIERAAEVFQEVKDARGLEEALASLTEQLMSFFNTTEAGRAWERLYEHASRAGEHQAERYRILQVFIAFHGPTPVADVVRLCEENLASPLRGGAEAKTMRLLGGLRAMQGDFAAGRELVSRARAIYEDLGMKIGAAMGACEMAWNVELPHDPARAEREFRRGYELLENMGETAMRSSVAAWLAHALVRQDRFDEAGQFASISEQLASSDDLLSQVMWRSARAHVYTHRGRLDEAVELAREAELITKPTSSPNLQADALLDLAAVLHRARGAEQAAAAAAAALELYEAKGNLVGAARAQAAQGREG